MIIILPVLVLFVLICMLHFEQTNKLAKVILKVGSVFAVIIAVVVAGVAYIGHQDTIQLQTQTDANCIGVAKPKPGEPFNIDKEICAALNH